MKTKNKRNYSNQKGITLIALVVTIVVLLILAGVSVNAIFSENGIIKRAKDAQNKMDQATQNDLDSINELNNWIDGKTNGTTGGNTTGGDANPSTTPKISTLVGKVVDKNTKAEDAYGNKITIPKGFKILEHNPTSSTGAVTYNYTNSEETGEHIPAVQDGIVIEDKDGNQFVWVPVGEIKNKDNTTNTITLGRYSDFTATSGVYTPVQSAENYTKETIMIFGNIQNQDYTIAKLGIKDNKENTIKMNRAIQLEGIINDKMVIKAAEAVKDKYYYKELVTFREGNYDRQENATARNLVEFVSTTLANGGYYIARFEASGTTSKIESKYNQTVLKSIIQPNAAQLAREMYGEIKENNKLVYASDLANSYAWDTAIIFIQTYSGESNYTNKNKSITYANTGINNDKYCNIWDMSGNVDEWTTESSPESDGSYLISCVYRMAASRGECSVGTKGDHGIRTIIYVD